MSATLTTDLAQGKADLAEHGYCLLEGLLPPDRVAETRARLVEVAQQEIADGTDYVYENGSNQRVWTLLNKGQCFIDIAVDATVCALMEHPAVFEVAVLAVPDAMMGEKVGAVVVPTPGARFDAGELAGFARERLADFKVPQFVSVRTAPLPRNPGGKVLKPTLRQETDWGRPVW